MGAASALGDEVSTFRCEVGALAKNAETCLDMVRQRIGDDTCFSVEAHENPTTFAEDFLRNAALMSSCCRYLGHCCRLASPPEDNRATPSDDEGRADTVIAFAKLHN